MIISECRQSTIDNQNLWYFFYVKKQDKMLIFQHLKAIL